MSSLIFANHILHPLGCGALFWERESLLLVADLHLEKGSHAAARGFPLPPYDSVETLTRLAAALAHTGARRVAALGDSFHDSGGAQRLPPPARDRLADLARGREWTWIAGNHDDAARPHVGSVVAEMAVAGVHLRHEAHPADPRPEISGHFHPSVRLRLRTGRVLRRRCFALAGERLVLPAYGAYAGGLDVADPAFVRALGMRPEAVVAAGGGLIRVGEEREDEVA